MKIVDVAEFYAEAGGGVRTYIDHKLRAGARAGHEIVVVAPAARSHEEAREGGRVVWVESPPMPGDPRYHLFTRAAVVHAIMDREAPDVVEGSSVYGGGWFVGSWSGHAVKSLVFHQDPVAALGHSFLDRFVARAHIDRAFAPVWSYLRRLSSRYDTTVVAGAWLKDRLTSFGVPRVEAVPFGIDPEPFLKARPDEALRRQLLEQAGLPHEAPLLISVSRHHPEKRLGVLIEAVREIQKARPVGLAIFGDGPSRPQIERLAQKAPGVVVAGYTRDRDQLARAMASANAFLHGSAAETYGLVVAEAICARTPVIVPSFGGAAELADAAYSETYRPGDVASCAAAIRRMLSRDPSTLAAALGRAAAGPIRTLDAHFDQLFAHYAQLSRGAPLGVL